MPFLRCTSKLLADIDDLPSMESPVSPLGDWYGHLFTIDRRKCLMFINEPTLFVCPIFDVVKADYRDIAPLFRKVWPGHCGKRRSLKMTWPGSSASMKTWR